MPATDPYLTILGIIVYGTLFLLARKHWRKSKAEATARLQAHAEDQRRRHLEALAEDFEEIERIRSEREQ